VIYTAGEEAPVTPGTQPLRSADISESCEIYRAETLAESYLRRDTPRSGRSSLPPKDFAVAHHLRLTSDAVANKVIE
jgi:hypothetical protein